jgi:hypothetical protein
MRNVVALMGLGAALFIGTAAIAAEPGESTFNAKRQLIACMSKSMSVNRRLFYNDAMKACKEHLDARGNDGIRKDALAANSPTDVPAVKTP